MNDSQKAAISEALPAYRSVLEKAYSGASKTAGVKAFCLRCVGFSKSDIRRCTSYVCPLHPYRPYQAADED